MKGLPLNNLVPILAVAVAVTFSASLISSFSPSATTSYGLAIGSQVCVSATENGVVKDLGCTDNAFGDTGRRIIGDLLAFSGGQNTSGNWLGNITFIAIGNGSTATTILQEYTDSGLARGAATTLRIESGAGNITISRTFTMSAIGQSKQVNSTSLFNASSGGQHFAGNNFTTVTLLGNDQINVTWRVWTTEG